MLAVVGVALIGSPEFGHNGNAVWGFVSGIISGAMLALSMVFVRKTHQIEPVPLFPVMMILSFGGAVSLIIPALVFDGGALYPTTLRADVADGLVEQDGDAFCLFFMCLPVEVDAVAFGHFLTEYGGFAR